MEEAADSTGAVADAVDGPAVLANNHPPPAHAPAAAAAAACIICMSDTPTHAFIPCGHKQMCAACAADAVIVQGLDERCPICRQKFICIVQIFEG